MGVHSRDELLAFLKGETRQVWARARATGDAVYLDVGCADEVRQVAKSEWGCIIPTCDAPITTRGGSRRDHFAHNEKGTGHRGGGAAETLNHQAAKGLLWSWASRVALDADVEEEKTIKKIAAQRDRRPDVSVTWSGATGRVLALEVEYKTFSYEAWKDKEADFDSEDIARTWLIGHTRFKPRLGEDPTRWDGAVTVPQQARILADAGLYVLVINPVTGQIGTVAGDRDFTKRVGPKQRIGWLRLNDVNDCQLTAAGIVTPAMRHLEDAARARELAAGRELDRRRATANAASRKGHESIESLMLRMRLASERQRDLAEQQRRREQDRARNAQWEEEKRAWEHSTLRKKFLERWGKVPEVIEEYGKHPRGIDAYPVHWHALLYEALVHERRPGATFGPSDCWQHLRAAGISWTTSNGAGLASMNTFLAAMQAAQLISRVGDDRWQVRGRYETREEERRRQKRERLQQQEEHESAAIAAAELRRDEDERREAEERGPVIEAVPLQAAMMNDAPTPPAPLAAPREARFTRPGTVRPELPKHGKLRAFFAKIVRR